MNNILIEISRTKSNKGDSEKERLGNRLYKDKKMFKYTDIYDKTGRFLERIQNTNRNSIDYEDDLHAFFVFCYHLKDYLIKDAKISPEIVKDYINKNPALTLCWNICNLTKHVEVKAVDYGLGHLEINMRECISLTRFAVSGTICEVGNEGEETENPINESINLNTERKENDSIKDESFSSFDQHYDIVDISGNKYDALEMAKECYILWTHFLKTHNLL